MKTYTITTPAEIRRRFWTIFVDHKKIPGWTQNQYPTDTRVAFCDWVAYLRRDGQISEALAQRTTL